MKWKPNVERTAWLLRREVEVEKRSRLTVERG